MYLCFPFQFRLNYNIPGRERKKKLCGLTPCPIIIIHLFLFKCHVSETELSTFSLIIIPIVRQDRQKWKCWQFWMAPKNISYSIFIQTCFYEHLKNVMPLNVNVVFYLIVVNVQLSLEETYADIVPVRLNGNSPSAFVWVFH